MKFIKTEKLGFVIFENRIDHCKMRDNILSADDKIISAGAIYCADEMMISCGGESMTLSIRPEKDDTTQLRNKLRMY